MAWWRRGGTDPAPPRSDAAPSAAPGQPPMAAAAVQRSAWQDLPPLRPTLTPTPPIAPLERFTNSLATAHNPSFLAPLGHAIDPDGPGGHVSGLASPVVPQMVSPHRELAVAPRPSAAGAMVQRMLAGPRLWFADDAAATTSARRRPRGRSDGHRTGRPAVHRARSLTRSRTRSMPNRHGDYRSPRRPSHERRRISRHRCPRSGRCCPLSRPRPRRSSPVTPRPTIDHHHGAPEDQD